MRCIVSAGLALALVSGSASAQQVFHSVQSANLPTAETLPRGSWLFEISHRFGPMEGGSEDLWGVDGPAAIRLGLQFAPHDRVLVALQRSNLDDNTELNAKIGVWSGGSEALPIKVALVGGAAVNMQPFEPGAEDDEAQLYGQLLVNALLGGRFALGVVPGYLHNPRLPEATSDGALAIGVHGQLYVSPSASFFGEWLTSDGEGNFPNDALAFGIELETRGHFFKILATNQMRLNSTQFLGGSNDEWRFGFNLTRLLPF